MNNKDIFKLLDEYFHNESDKVMQELASFSEYDQDDLYGNRYENNRENFDYKLAEYELLKQVSIFFATMDKQKLDMIKTQLEKAGN